jgi:glycosyltransferase involved in cell wall biosynthesis
MLLNALASIHAQEWQSVEILVVDGGSTDGSVEWLKSRREIRLLEGPDDGVYDAVNKGMAAAQGEIVGWLNSDDSYEAGAFGAVARAFTNSPTADAVCGAATLIENGQVIARYDRLADKALSPRASLIGNCVPNARFFRRASVERIGPFDTQYRYVADRDWLMRWHEAGMVTVPIAQSTYRYNRHPGSLTLWADPRWHTKMRHDLLRLARSWRDNGAASAETRRIAALLEGRCLTTLAIDSIRTLDLMSAGRLLLTENGRPTIAPALAATRSMVDVIRNRA